jgi:hypothetical protein
MNDEHKRWKNTERANKSFQIGLLSAENLFVRHTKASFTVLIVDDRPQQVIPPEVRPQYVAKVQLGIGSLPEEEIA